MSKVQVVTKSRPKRSKYAQASICGRCARLVEMPCKSAAAEKGCKQVSVTD